MFMGATAVRVRVARWFLVAALVVSMMTTSVVGYNISDGDLPTSVDWREAVTPVKKQGHCGSCWAFAAVAAVEAAHTIHSGWKVSLSEQQLVDCELRDDACIGGHADHALQWIVDNGGITGEADYPYTGARGLCDSEKLRHYGVTISGYQLLESCNEDALMLAVASQPVIVSVDARSGAFTKYSSGVFEGPCGTYLSHQFLLVGYGQDKNGGYWIAKNSWGRGWGEGGYMYLRRGVEPCGLCGLAAEPIIPLI